MSNDRVNLKAQKTINPGAHLMLGAAGAALLAGLLAAPASAQGPAQQTPAGLSEAPDQAPETDVDEERSLERVVVTSRAQQLYRTEITSAGKLPTEPLAASQLISAITDDLIEDQGARTSQDLYRNISGVSFYSYAGVTARGFEQEENFFDGLRGDPYNGFSVPQLFGIERAEFLKGPAGMLYGQSAPGGIFNYVTKKPGSSPAANLRATLGENKRYGGSGDITGPIADNINGRAGLFYETKDTLRFNADSEVFIADGGLAFNIANQTLTVQLMHLETDLGGNRLRGIPVDDQGSFLADRRWNGNEADDFLRLNSSTAQFRLEGELTDQLTYDLSGRYIDAEEHQEYHNPRALFDNNADGSPDGVTREFRKQLRANEIFSLGGNAIWSTRFSDNISNRVLAGADFSEDRGYEEAARARGTAGSTSASTVPTPLTFVNPRYGVTNRANYTLDINNPGSDLNVQQFGVYGLNELTLGQFILTGGIRLDSFENNVDGVSYSDEELTYRGGIVYRVTPTFSLYGQYATSFEPQDVSTQATGAGGPFEPTTGDMIEGGAKASLFDGRLQPSIAFYEIKRSNLVQSTGTDPEDDGVDNFVSLGEVTSTGFDFDLAADITPDWVATLTYAYNDARVTKDGGLGQIGDVGDRFANAPKHQLGFWTRYQIRPLGLAFAVGGDHVGERISRSGQRVKPYTVFDASVIYETDDWKLLVRIDNVFDKTYAASGFTEVIGHFPGAPRSVFAEITRRF